MNSYRSFTILLVIAVFLIGTAINGVAEDTPPSTRPKNGDGFVVLYGAALVPLSSEIEDLNVMWGGGIAYQQDRWRFSAEGLLGEGELYTRRGRSTFDTRISGLSATFLFSPVSHETGGFGGVGVGYYTETVDLASEVSASTPSFHVIGGYKTKTSELHAKLMAFAGSGNTTVALTVGAGFAF